jgi:hypothetical protein
MQASPAEASFRPVLNKASPKQMDRRKRFLEASLASAPSPSPPPLPALETLRRDTALPTHLVLNAARHYRTPAVEAELEPASKLSFWRTHPGLQNPASAAPAKLSSNPASSFRFSPQLIFKLM